MNNGWNAIGDFLGSAFGGIGNIAGGILNTGANAVGGAFNTLGNLGTSAQDMLTSSMSGVGNNGDIAGISPNIMNMPGMPGGNPLMQYGVQGGTNNLISSMGSAAGGGNGGIFGSLGNFLGKESTVGLGNLGLGAYGLYNQNQQFDKYNQLQKDVYNDQTSRAAQAYNADLYKHAKTMHNPVTYRIENGKLVGTVGTSKIHESPEEAMARWGQSTTPSV